MRSKGAEVAGQRGRPEQGGPGRGCSPAGEGGRSLGLTAITGGGPLVLLCPEHISQGSVPFRQMPPVPTLCL